MNRQNICKFYTPSQSDPILIHCFVLESKPEEISQIGTLPHNRMLLVTEGQGVLSVNSAPMPFRTGDLLFGFLGDRIEILDHVDTTLMYVDFSGNRAENLLRRFGINGNNRRFEGFGGIIPFWKESLLRASPETIDLAAESVLLHTLSRMKSEKPSQNEIISAVLQITENNFNDHELSIVSIGEELSYHPKYLSHLFKKEMGVGFSEYLRDKRINYARTLLDHGLDSIKNVSLLSGFNDPLYFSNVFKKVTGISPKQYVEQQKSKQSENASDSSDAE